MQLAPGGRCRPDDPTLDRACLPRLDQLLAERTQQGVRDRRRARGPETPDRAERVPQQWIVTEAQKELRVVVVERQYEAQVLQTRLALGPQHEPPVHPLPSATE